MYDIRDHKPLIEYIFFIYVLSRHAVDWIFQSGNYSHVIILEDGELGCEEKYNNINVVTVLIVIPCSLYGFSDSFYFPTFFSIRYDRFSRFPSLFRAIGTPVAR